MHVQVFLGAISYSKYYSWLETKRFRITGESNPVLYPCHVRCKDEIVLLINIVLCACKNLLLTFFYLNIDHRQ
jgi:hypothetical protein